MIEFHLFTYESCVCVYIYIYDVYTVSNSVWALYLSVDGRGTRKEKSFCGLLDFVLVSFEIS